MALADNINWWRDLDRKPFQASELPAMNLKDENVERDYHASGQDGYLMTVSIQAIAATIEEIRTILADLEKAIDQDRTWGSLALHSELKINDAEVEHLGKQYFAVRVPLEVYYVTALGDPYTAG